MGAVEQAVDAAANFVGPFVDAGVRQTARSRGEELDNAALVREAIGHLQAINTADIAADPDAPYDASLAGVVYGLLDLITSLGILPYLSAGVAFSQRPRSVLIATFTTSRQDKELLIEVLTPLLSVLGQKEGTGLQPLIAQRSLPDFVSALAELAFSPQHTEQVHFDFEPAYNDLLAQTPTSRLLPILTTFLQQSLPAWLKTRMSKELATVPVRTHGVRHVIEFLSLSYLSKNSQVPQDASGSQSRIPIPLEAVTQASKLLVSPPSGTSQDEWLSKLEPQLWSLVDGKEGRELSRAAGQIVAGGVLSKRSTGAPGTIGWRLFAEPLLQIIYPKGTTGAVVRGSTEDRVLVQDHDLLLALQRLAVITNSYSYSGLIKRLIGPLILPLWCLINYARSKRSLDKAWGELPRSIMLRYLSIACDPKQMDTIATNLFWDGPSDWTVGPGTKGGIELRLRRSSGQGGTDGMDSILSRISDLTGRIDLLVSLLADGKVSDDAVGLIFLQVTKRWLNPTHTTKTSLLLESDDDPLTALADAKLSEALANKFKHSFARSPQHIVELMGQLLQNYVSDHRARAEREAKSQRPSRANLGSIVSSKSESEGIGKEDTAEDDVASFAISILDTLVSTSDFQKTTAIDGLLSHVTVQLQYLVQGHQSPISPTLTNAAHNLLQELNPSVLAASLSDADPLASHRATLQAALQDLTSPEAPNRAWSLSTLHTLIKDPASFPVINVASTAYMILSASIADPESYVHSAAIPVLVSLALRAPHPTLKILTDAFLDVDERSLSLTKGRMTDSKQQELQESLDYRLRVAEVLSHILTDNAFWLDRSVSQVKYSAIKHITSACLSLASRRGQRTKTQRSRHTISLDLSAQRAEEEAAWGGPIPNLLDPEDASTDREDYEALAKIVQGWEATGIEEDVRIRASALSLFGVILEQRGAFVSQSAVDAGLQVAMLVLTLETGDVLSILRRAAVLLVMGLLRGVDRSLDAGEASTIDLGARQAGEVERVLRWVRDEDGDELVRDHAQSVLEGLETLRMKKLYRVRDEGVRLDANLGLEGGLRGLNVRPEATGGRRMVVEEIE